MPSVASLSTRVLARSRHAAVVILTCTLIAVLLPSNSAPARASTDYQQLVDLTFPVAGKTSYIDDYATCRSGCSRRHQATDIMAPYGAKVHAAVGGQVTFITGLTSAPPSYGYMISIAGDDGRKYNYIHLGRQDGPPSEAYASGLQRGSRVERGQHIGYVGHSGNASAAAPHLHFEIEKAGVVDPYGGERINPYRSLKAAQSRDDVPGGTGAYGPSLRRIQLSGDWNGDGVDTVGWFQDGRWTLRNSHSSGEPDIVLTYGRAGDIPVVGDWNGDGRDTVGVVRDGNRWILRQTYKSGDDIVLTYGRKGDVPVAGDWNGDGRDTVGVVRDGNRWILRQTYMSGDDIVLRYGKPGDKPVTGDFNGDGRDTLGVVRENRFILRYEYRSGADIVLNYGRASDAPVTGDWNGDGRDTLGVVRDGRWILRYVYMSGADYVYTF